MNEGGIDRLRDALYARGARRVGPRPRRPLQEEGREVRGMWPDSPEPMPIRPRRRFSMNAFFLGSLAFFLAAVALSAFFIFGGTNVVSTENIDILVEGPTTIAGGETLTLTVTIVNKNAVAIKLTDLIVEYPPGTRSADDLNKELPRERFSVGEIGPGERAARTIPAVLFGEEGKDQTILFTVEYRIDGSNAIFFKEQPYVVLLSSSPLRLSVKLPSEAISGQEFVIRVEISSNATAIVHDALLKAEYPFGFSFVSGVPTPSSGTNVFAVGDLPPAGRRVVEIRGSLSGQDGEERVFRFTSGTRSAKDDKEIAAAFAVSTQSITIRRPFLAVDAAVNGVSLSEHVITAGKPIRLDLTFRNNLPGQIFDGEIVVRLDGGALDPASVSSERGFFNSSERTITWSRETDSAFAVIDPGVEGQVSATFLAVGLPRASALRNPEIVLTISARGRRLGDADVPEEISSLQRVSLKVATELLFSSRASYAAGPFKNSGPIPPKADTPTTYTVVWTISSAMNSVNNLVVEAPLPSYVRWLGAAAPESERLTYNPVGGTVRWSVGSLPPGTSSPREVAFQVEVTPSKSQVGGMPAIVGEQVAGGTDQFTGSAVSATRLPLTTEIKTESGFPAGGGVVRE